MTARDTGTADQLADESAISVIYNLFSGSKRPQPGVTDWLQIVLMTDNVTSPPGTFPSFLA